MSARGGFVTLAGGGRVAFEVDGDGHAGTPALLLRPLVGQMHLWGAFREVLAERFRVIAYDPRGTDPSSHAPLMATTRDMARDAVAVLDALGVPVAHVFGISLGAMVATWLAIDAPERVARLCLASAGPTGHVLTASGLERGAAMLASALVPGEDPAAGLSVAVLSRKVREDGSGRAEAVAEAEASDHSERSEIAKHAIAAARHDARTELHRIVAPTLVLAGDHDELLGEGPTIALAAAIVGARREVIADAGHDLTLEKPVETARRVAAFFGEDPEETP
jgi:3-oxoadipate enol-lactonase